jgi:hypothetical protein
MIRVDLDNPRAVQLAERLRGYLEHDRLDETLCVVVGGDGFMLESIRAQGPGFTFLGLNAGTLGFLLNDIDDVANVGRAIHDGRYEVYDFPRLEVTIENGAAAPPPDFAVNDVYAERMTGKTANLRLTINGVRIVDRIVTDGFVVAHRARVDGVQLLGGWPRLPPVGARHPRHADLSAHAAPALAHAARGRRGRDRGAGPGDPTRARGVRRSRSRPDDEHPHRSRRGARADRVPRGAPVHAHPRPKLIKA